MKKAKGMTLKTRNGLIGIVMLLPWIMGLIIFTVGPMLYSIWLSVCSVSFGLDGIQTEFIGIKWYGEAMRGDVHFMPMLLDTIKFIAFTTPMMLVASVIFALLLNKPLKARGFFSALFFFPVVFIIGPVMNKLIGNDATAIIQPGKYAVYQVIETLPDMISEPLLYIFDNIVLIFWFSGIQILIVLAALQKISTSLYEAAAIDGASHWQAFWKITLPSLRPMLLVVAVYTIVDLSGYSGNSITGYIKANMTITQKTYSYSSAMAWIYSFVVLLLLLAAFLIFRERGSKQ